mmetsp:Transcript_25397/g.62898  ORF Transcript_25397/g.62898 Transcript_25397/m.62898 type:complete len:88 (+) Transcript_25397:615-878(+)
MQYATRNISKVDTSFALSSDNIVPYHTYSLASEPSPLSLPQPHGHAKPPQALRSGPLYRLCVPMSGALTLETDVGWAADLPTILSEG